MPDPADLVTSYARLVATLRARVLHLVGATWVGLGDYREPDIDRFVARVVPVVIGAQRQVASLTDAYLSSLQEMVTEQPTRPVGVPVTVATGGRGVAPADVYHRAGVTVWSSLAAGEPLDVAAGRGQRRAESMAATDLQMAKTRSSQYALSRRSGVVGFRRVLSGSNSCGLCAVASTQRYRAEELMPIHPGCSCTVAPIFGQEDPGQVIDAERLADVHASIAERFGVSDESARGPVDYRDALIVHQHGEIGPVLAVRGQQFTGPGDL